MMFKLTKPQLAELKKLAKEPQRTYGSHRARVQRNLYYLSLAEFYNDDGHTAKYIEGADQCRITTQGQTFLTQAASSAPSSGAASTRRTTRR